MKEQPITEHHAFLPPPGTYERDHQGPLLLCFFPVTINNETRWLERVTIEEQAVADRLLGGGIAFWHKNCFKDLDFTSSPSILGNEQ